MDLSLLSTNALPAAAQIPLLGAGRALGPGDEPAPVAAFSRLLAGQAELLRSGPGDLSAGMLADADSLSPTTALPDLAEPVAAPADAQDTAGAAADAGPATATQAFGEAHPGGMAAWLAAWTPANAAVVLPATAPATATATAPVTASSTASAMASAIEAAPALTTEAAHAQAGTPATPDEAVAAGTAPSPTGAAAAPALSTAPASVAGRDRAMHAGAEPSAGAVSPGGSPAQGPGAAQVIARPAMPRAEAAPASPSQRSIAARAMPLAVPEEAATPEATADLGVRKPGHPAPDEPAAFGRAELPSAPLADSATPRNSALLNPRATGEALATPLPGGTASTRTDPRGPASGIPPGEPVLPTAQAAGPGSAVGIAGVTAQADSAAQAPAEPVASGMGLGPAAPEFNPPLPTSVPGTTQPAPAMPMALPPTELNLPTPVHAPEFTEALGVQVSLLARDGIQEAELHLNPAEMGPISVRIALDGQRAQVDFGVDSAATRAMLEAGLPELASAMREAGLTLTGGGVSQHARGDGAAAQGGRSGEGTHQPGGGHGRDSGRDPAPADDAPAARPRNLRMNGSVDLYA